MLKVLFAPFVGAYVVVYGLFLALFYALKFVLTYVLPGIILSPTSYRLLSEKCVVALCDQREDPCRHKIGIFFSVLSSLCILIVCANKFFNGLTGELLWGLGFYGLLGTNLLSFLYELGCWGMNKKNKEKDQEVHVTTETGPGLKQDDDDDDPIDNFTRLLNQIEEILNSDSFEETIKALLEEIEKLFKTGDLTFEQVRHLAKLIDNAKAEKAGLAKV